MFGSDGNRRIGKAPSGVSYYRMIWPAQAVQDMTGWDIQMLEFGDDLQHPGEIDLVVTQRIHGPHAFRPIAEQKARGARILMDVDDALWAIPRGNAAWKGFNEIAGGMRRWEWCDMAAGVADAVTVTTPLLQRRYGGDSGKGIILPNRLPDWALNTEPLVKRDEVTIGWAANIDSHPGDLEVVGRSVKRIMERDRKVRFRIVGSRPERIAEVLDIPEDRIDAPGWIPIDRYHEALQEFDVMLVPLKKSGFNNAKSYIKGLEASAAGAAVVATATPAYKDLAKLTAVSLVTPAKDASRECEWEEKILDVIDAVRNRPHEVRTPEQCAELTMSANAAKWVEAWEFAMSK